MKLSDLYNNNQFKPVDFYECPFCHTKQDLHKQPRLSKETMPDGSIRIWKKCLFCERRAFIEVFK